MFRKLKEKRKIKKIALQFPDKINRLGDLFKSYGFDVQYRNRIWNPRDNFYLRLQGDNVLELIHKLGNDLNVDDGFYGLCGKFNQEIKIDEQYKAKENTIFIYWKYEYYGYNLSTKLRKLDYDIMQMEKIVYKKGETK